MNPSPLDRFFCCEPRTRGPMKWALRSFATGFGVKYIKYINIECYKLSPLIYRKSFCAREFLACTFASWYGNALWLLTRHGSSARRRKKGKGENRTAIASSPTSLSSSGPPFEGGKRPSHCGLAYSPAPFVRSFDPSLRP